MTTDRILGILRRSPFHLAIAIAAAALAILSIAVPAHAAEPPTLWQRGDVVRPTGIAVDPASGDVYVADPGASTIRKYSIWGEPIGVIGSAGSGPGQLGSPQGVALDSAGGLYVFDSTLKRLQKFDLSGSTPEFEWMIGAGVNQGPNNPGDRCDAADVAAGDICGPGSAGSGPGQFGSLPEGGGEGVRGPNVALTPSGEVLAGDVGRVQHFDTDGNFLSDTPVSGEVVNSVATGPAGELYVTYWDQSRPGGNSSKPDVRRVDPLTGAVLAVFPAGRPIPFGAQPKGPTATAVDGEGHLYAFVEATADSGPVIIEFDSEGNQINGFAELGKDCKDPTKFFDCGGAGGSWGMAASSACGLASPHLYVGKRTGHSNPAFLRAYGLPPDTEVCPPPAVAPNIGESFATGVGTTVAQLRARINPHFWPDATYWVEYGDQGPCGTNPCQALPATALTEEVVDDEVDAAVELTGLRSGTTYHYRFVAQSGGGGPVFGVDRTFTTFPEPDPHATGCQNDHFRSGPSASLPNCRAYELVTPVDKNGGDIVSLFGNGLNSDANGNGRRGYHYQATADGSKLTYSAYKAFGEAESAPWNSQYVATRDPGSGWRNENLNVPRGPVIVLGQGAQQENPFLAFNDNLCWAWVAQDTDTTIGNADNAGLPDLYRRDNCSGAGMLTLITNKPPSNFTPYEQTEGGALPMFRVGGVSDDGARTAFTANARLLTAAPASVDQFKVYLNNLGALRLVSVLPDGSAPTVSAAVGSREGYDTMSELRGYSDNLDNAVSADGSRVFWTTKEGRLYLRVNADRAPSPISGVTCTNPAQACTLPVSETVDPGAARFWKASPDGSKALYAFTAGAHIGELYRYDLATRTSTLLATGLGGVAGASDDLSRVYFASTDVLAPGAAAGEDNLYFLEQGEDPRFVATVKDDFGSNLEDAFAFAIAADNRKTRVTPDGSHLAFATAAALTAYDNRDPVTDERAVEAYVYDADADQLHCVSCARTGARPTPRQFGKVGVNDYAVDARFPGWMSALYPGNVFSADGKRLFFESFSRLAPQDTNGKGDVYQWEATGSGDCDIADASFDAAAGGCVSLISSGKSPADSGFVDASADGSDVFINTAESLVGSDEGLFDIYDARIGGGFPEPVRATSCEGEACQGALAAPPSDPGVASGVARPGNAGRDRTPAVKRCKKGKRLKRGKCVPKKNRKNTHKKGKVQR